MSPERPAAPAPVAPRPDVHRADVHRAAWRDLDPETAYAVVRLRVDVFVVEQDCPYAELDGRDLEPGAEHLWMAGGGRAVGAYLRVLHQGEDRRIGRVVTAAPARGRGLAGVLLQHVVDEHGSSRRLVLDAQAHLVDWYARWGFTPSGPGFLEDGIPHVPMARAPRP